MNVIINGKEKSFDESSVSLIELLKQNNVQRPDMISVQLNEVFIKKEDYQGTIIKDGDIVDYIYFMGGGQQ